MQQGAWLRHIAAGAHRFPAGRFLKGGNETAGSGHDAGGGDPVSQVRVCADKSAPRGLQEDGRSKAEVAVGEGGGEAKYHS